MLELKRGGHARVQTENRIYRLACPVLKKTSNLVISRRNRAGTAKKCTKNRDARTGLLFC